MAGVYTFTITSLPVGLTLEDGPLQRLLVVGLPTNSDGTPSHAAAAGIEVGDSIVRVEKEDITPLDFDESIARLRRATVPLSVTVARPTADVRDQLLAEAAALPEGSEEEGTVDEDGDVEDGESGQGDEEEEDGEDDEGGDDGGDDGDDGDNGDDGDDEDGDDEDTDENEGPAGKEPGEMSDATPATEEAKPKAGAVLFGMEEVFGMGPPTEPGAAVPAPEETKPKKPKKPKKNKEKSEDGKKAQTTRRPYGLGGRDPAVIRQEAQQRFIEARNTLESRSEARNGPLLKDYSFFQTGFKDSEDLKRLVNAAVYRHHVEEPGITYDERSLRREQAKHLERFWRDGVERGGLVQKGLLALGVEATLVYLGLLNKEGQRAGSGDPDVLRSPTVAAKAMRESSNPVVQEVAEQLEVTPCLVDVRSKDFPVRVEKLLRKVQLLLDQANVQGQHLDRMSVELDKHSGVFEARVSHVAGLLGRRSQIIRDRVEYLLAARQRHQYTVFQTRAALGHPLDGAPASSPSTATTTSGDGNGAVASAADHGDARGAASAAERAVSPSVTAEETAKVTAAEENGALLSPRITLAPADRLEAEALLAEALRSVQEIEGALDALLPETGLVQLYTGRENAMRRNYLSGRLHLKARFNMLAQRYAEMLQVGEIQKNEFMRLEEEAASLVGGAAGAGANERDESEDAAYKIQLALPPVAFEECLKQLPEQTVEQVKNWAKRKFAIAKDASPPTGNGEAAAAVDPQVHEEVSGEDVRNEGASSVPQKKVKKEEKEGKRGKSSDGRGSGKKRSTDSQGGAADLAKRQRLSM